MQNLSSALIDAQVIADYRAVAGKVVLLSEVECYDAHGDSVTVTCDPPVIGRIFPYGSRDAIRQNVTRWMDHDHCDPVYDIEILERHPALEGLRPSWVYGTCRNRSGTTEPAGIVLADAEMQLAYAGAPAVDYEANAVRILK